MTLLVGLLVLKTATFTTPMQNGSYSIGNKGTNQTAVAAPNANGGGISGLAMSRVTGAIFNRRPLVSHRSGE